MELESKFKLTKCLQALATFVGLDPATGKTSVINPLLIESPEDQQRFDEIDALVKVRKSSLQLKWHSSVSFQVGIRIAFERDWRWGVGVVVVVVDVIQ